jgi:hypothetical protein
MSNDWHSGTGVWTLELSSLESDGGIYAVYADAESALEALTIQLTWDLAMASDMEDLTEAQANPELRAQAEALMAERGGMDAEGFHVEVGDEALGNDGTWLIRWMPILPMPCAAPGGPTPRAGGLDNEARAW